MKTVIFDKYKTAGNAKFFGAACNNIILESADAAETLHL